MSVKGEAAFQEIPKRMTLTRLYFPGVFASFSDMIIDANCYEPVSACS